MKLKSARSRVRILLLLLPLATAGCVRGCTSSRPPIHPNPNMDDQPRYDPQSESAFFYDGATMRLPVEGTVARGEFYEDEILATGLDENFDFVATSPVETTPELLARGAERYDIFCRPCHGEIGDGAGVLFDYGVPVTSFDDERLVNVPDGELFNVITNGKGLMPSYKYPIPVHDRWAIVARVREMQRERQGSSE